MSYAVRLSMGTDPVVENAGPVNPYAPPLWCRLVFRVFLVFLVFRVAISLFYLRVSFSFPVISHLLNALFQTIVTRTVFEVVKRS